MKRDENGKVKLNVIQKFKSWSLGRKLRKGKLPRGRVTSEEAKDALKMGACKNALEGFGLLSARVLSSNGSIKQDLGLISCEKITTAFRDYIVDSLQNSTTYPLDAFKYHASGTSNTAEANTQTALGVEIESRVVGTQIEGATANVYKTVATIPYTGTHAVVEHGLFSAAAAGTMMDRSVFSAINVVSSDSIEFTYEATFQAEA